MDHMVFGFHDAVTRNAAGRALRKAGFQCFGSGPTSKQTDCLLTVVETTTARRSAAVDVIRLGTNDARRLH